MARLYKMGNNVTNRSEAAARWPRLVLMGMGLFLNFCCIFAAISKNKKFSIFENESN